MDGEEAAPQIQRRPDRAQRRLLPRPAGPGGRLGAAFLAPAAALHAARVPGGLPPAAAELAGPRGRHRLRLLRHRVLPAARARPGRSAAVRAGGRRPGYVQAAL